MSDTIGTFWIVTGQNDVYTFGDSPKPRSRTFTFTLTQENFNSWGYITLMVRNVDFQHNRVTLNGHFIGNLDPTGNTWTQQTLIVEVYDTQKFGDGPPNHLVIESNNSSGGETGNLDDFEVKHIIFHHRTNR